MSVPFMNRNYRVAVRPRRRAVARVLLVFVLALSLTGCEAWSKLFHEQDIPRMQPKDHAQQVRR